MEFRQIQYFVCLYEEGSVTRAARRLNIVQPALSMQIAKLEDELGKALFIRSSRGMEPTDDARHMYRLFLPVLRDFARAREHMLHTGGALTGQVRIGMIATISQGVLVDALLEFSAQYPQVLLSLTDGFSSTLVDAVSGGQLDAALINKPRRALALNSETIAEEDVLLLTGPKHARLPASLSLEEVARLKLVFPTRQHGLRGILESFAQTEGLVLEPRAEIDAVSGILKLVSESDFATLLPRIAAHRQLEQGSLHGYSVTSPQLKRQIVCVTHPRRAPGPAATAFLAVLARHLRRVLGGQELRDPGINASW